MFFKKDIDYQSSKNTALNNLSDLSEEFIEIANNIPIQYIDIGNKEIELIKNSLEAAKSNIIKYILNNSNIFNLFKIINIRKMPHIYSNYKIPELDNKNINIGLINVDFEPNIYNINVDLYGELKDLAKKELSKNSGILKHFNKNYVNKFLGSNVFLSSIMESFNVLVLKKFISLLKNYKCVESICYLDNSNNYAKSTYRAISNISKYNGDEYFVAICSSGLEQKLKSSNILDINPLNIEFLILDNDLSKSMGLDSDEMFILQESSINSSYLLGIDNLLGFSLNFGDNLMMFTNIDVGILVDSKIGHIKFI